MLDGNRGDDRNVLYRSTCVWRKRQRNAERARRRGGVGDSEVVFDERRHDRGIETVESNGAGICNLACVQEAMLPTGRSGMF